MGMTTTNSQIESMEASAKILRCGCTGWWSEVKKFLYLNHSGAKCPTPIIIDLGVIAEFHKEV